MIRCSFHLALVRVRGRVAFPLPPPHCSFPSFFPLFLAPLLPKIYGNELILGEGK